MGDTFDLDQLSCDGTHCTSNVGAVDREKDVPRTHHPARRENTVIVPRRDLYGTLYPYPEEADANFLVWHVRFWSRISTFLLSPLCSGFLESFKKSGFVGHSKVYARYKMYLLMVVTGDILYVIGQ